jgi:phospholipid/cholesterol/gamma-HCH transport system ATP-binding protein
MTTAPSIRLEGLSIGYGRKIVAENLDIEFPGGQLSMVVGGSGSGKSTLIKHVLGLQPVITGKVFVGGHDMSNVSRRKRQCIRQRTGVLFQDGALLGSLKLKDNIALPLREHTSLTEGEILRIVEDRLAMVGLDHALELYPNELSGGMRKRAGLARALVMDPEMLLLEMMCQFDMTMVVVTHDLRSMHALADFVVVLGEQRCLFQGSIEELDSTEDAYLRRFLDRTPGERDAPRLTLPPISQDKMKLNCAELLGAKASGRKDGRCSS